MNNAYSKWCTKEEIKKNLTPVKVNDNIKKGGIPILYEKDSLYINDHNINTLVIANLDSDKESRLIYPLINLSIKASESFVVNDCNGEMYNKFACVLKREGYNVKVLNLNNFKLGNRFNPLYFPYELYKKGYIEEAINVLEDIAYYIFHDDSSDSFWVKSASDYFIGLALYLFDKGEEKINFGSIFSISSKLGGENNKYREDFLNSLELESYAYVNLSSILLAPYETMAGIIVTFDQKMKFIISRASLISNMSNDDFEILNFGKEKQAVFIVSTMNKVGMFVPMLVNEIFSSISIFGNREKRVNFILDDFNNLVAFNDFPNMLINSKNFNAKFIIFVDSYTGLINNYSKETAEVIKLCFSMIVYLLSNDIATLNEISNIFGKTIRDGLVLPLITADELRLLDAGKALVIMPRMLPIKTNFLCDSEVDWGLNGDEKELPL